MKVIYKEPGVAPVVRDIPNTLEELQKAVGGYIESVTIATDAAIIVNEEGRLLSLPYNCTICGLDFYGPLLIVGVDGENFCDLQDGWIDPLMRSWLKLHEG